MSQGRTKGRQKCAKTRRTAIAKGTCISFCNQLRQNLATSRESRRYVVLRMEAFIATSGESKAHFALPWYALGKIAVNVTWMERGFTACQTHRSMYPSIFNRFPVIQPVSSKVQHFSTFLHSLSSPGYASGTIAVNVTRLERGFNACKMPRCIYPSTFNRF